MTNHTIASIAIILFLIVAFRNHSTFGVFVWTVALCLELVKLGGALMRT